MGEKKHIDRLFQESFKDFEAMPSDAVWTSIESKLNNKKKKRRVIPIWWRYAGIAALFLLFLSLGGLYINKQEPSSNIQVVDTNTPLNVHTSDDSLDSSEPALANSQDNTEKTEEKTSSIQSKKSNIINPALKVASTTQNSTIHPQSKSGWNDVKFVQQDKISTNSSSKTNSTLIASSNKANEVTLSNKNEPKQEKLEERLAINSMALNDNQKDIPENNHGNNAATNSLTIEEALDKTKDILDDEKPENRWSIAPNIAPVYFNTLNDGSSIDRQFNNNSKTGDVNMSYGISTSYAINKKLKIRSGINKVNLGYNTNDVAVLQSSGTASSTLVNIDNRNNSVDIANNTAIESSSNTAVISSNSSINQSFGYIEVPLEIQYTFYDRRLGINVIGGFSSLFLENNEIYSEIDNGPRTYLGEANNINDISYSANLGLGLNYKFSKKIDFNLEPTFKYQFNTFSNTSGDFTPFFIGVYTGFAIKF